MGMGAMIPQKLATWQKVLVGLAWCGVPVIITFFMLPKLQEFGTLLAIENNHTTTTGTIVLVDVIPGRRSAIYSHTYYSFTASGQAFAGISDWYKADAEQSPIAVWYNPANPSQNMRAPNDAGAQKIAGYVFIAIIGATVLLAVWVVWRLATRS